MATQTEVWGLTLASNRLNETTNASLAVAHGDIFIRTHKHLWCIGEK